MLPSLSKTTTGFKKTHTAKKYLLIGFVAVLASVVPISADAQRTPMPGTVTISLLTSVLYPASATPAKISAVYEVKYTGPETPAVTAMKFNCGVSGQSDVSPASSSGNIFRFRCDYPATDDSYTANATAWGWESGASVRLAENSGFFKFKADGTSPSGGSNPSTAGDEGGYKSMVMSILSPLFILLHGLMLAIFWFLILPLINLLVTVQVGIGSCGGIGGGGTGFLANICSGWLFVRNLVNMLFILILIVIGIATILRIQAYSYKKLLGMLIIMALLVNFSLPIAQAVLKLADVAQFGMSPGVGWNSKILLLGTALINYQLIVVADTNIFAGAIKTAVIQNTQILVMVQELFNLCMSFLAFAVFAAIAAYLLIRIVALSILLVLSPVAYAFMAIPQGAGLAKQWWSTFFKYAFFTPIMLFFVNIAYLIYVKFNAGGGMLGQLDQNGMLAAITGGKGSPGVIENMIVGALQNVVVVGFLIGALQVAKKLAIFGSGFLTNMGEKALMLPLMATAAAGGAAGGALVGAGTRAYSHKMGTLASAAEQAKDFKKADRYKMLSLLNPMVAKKAWEERKKEKEMEAYGPAAGHSRDALNRFMPTEWHKDKTTGQIEMGKRTSYGRIGEKGVLNYKKGEYKDAQLSEEELVKAYLGSNDAVDKAALRQLLIEGRHEDGLRIIEALEAQKVKEDEYFTQFKAAGHNDLASRQLAKNKVQEDVESGKMDAAVFDNVDDKIKEHDWRLAHGMSEAESGSVSSQNAELSEATNMKRGLGEDVNYDGQFWSASSTGLWNHMEAKEGSSAMLDKLASLNMENLAVTKTQKVLDKDNNVVKRTVKNEATGEMEEQEVEVPVELTWRFKDKNGVEQERKIKDAQSFQEVIKEASKDNGVSNASKGNLRYEVTGALMEESGRKRIMRGNQERWAGADEPAAYMEQNQRGEFTRFTSAGRRMLINKSPGEVNSFRNSRGGQSRAMKIGGFYVNDETGETELKMKDIFLDLYDMNKDYAKALMEKSDFDEDQAAKIAKDLTEYCRVNKVMGKDNKLRTFGLGAKGPRGGYSVHEGDPDQLWEKNRPKGGK